MPTIEFDPEKSDRNAKAHGLPFERAAEFEWETAFVVADVRRSYGGHRLVATGYLEERLHVMCFIRIPDGIRVISLRKANSREIRAYEKTTATDG